MNHYGKLAVAALALLLAGLTTTSTLADDCRTGPACDEGYCARSECDDRCSRACRLVCKEREIEALCWAAECKDVCLPSHSKRGCKQCDRVDCFEGCCDCGPSKKLVWYHWIPGCAKVRTKKHLMMKTVTKKVPGYEWVVAGPCAGCEAFVEAKEVASSLVRPPRNADFTSTIVSKAEARASNSHD